MLGEPIPDALDLEENVVGTWFPRLGALALLLGAGFGFRYAVDRGWIGPGARVASGVAIGVLLLLLGETTKRRGWAGYAQAVTGGGVAILYLTVWASFALYGMVSDPVAFALLVGVTTLAAGLALRHDSVALAVLATLGGFLNPIVVGRGRSMLQACTRTRSRWTSGSSHWPPFGVGNSWTRSRSWGRGRSMGSHRPPAVGR